MGNADAWLLTGTDSGAEQITDARRKQMDDVRCWQLSQLTTADQEFMRAFQPTVEFPLTTLSDRTSTSWFGNIRTSGSRFMKGVYLRRALTLARWLLPHGAKPRPTTSCSTS